MSQYPYDQQPAQPYCPDPQQYYPEQSYGGQQPTYPPPAQQGYTGQGYPQPAYYPPQPPPAPVQVNVNQYAGGPVVVSKRVNHGLHFCLTLFTGGLWLFVWIPLAMRGGKTQVYR